MKTEEMRIAVAESVGWKRVTTTESVMHWPGGMLPTEVTRWSQHILKIDGKILAACVQEEGGLPDYPNDLNAMHEVENELVKQGQWIAYCKILETIAKTPYKATAAQRCEAYLRVKGLWVEEGPNV